MTKEKRSMHRMVAGYLVAAALALGALAGMAPPRAEAAGSAPPSFVHDPRSLVQTVQYYGRPGYYGRRGFYGGLRFYRPGPRFYGRGPGYYGRRSYYR